MTKKVGRNDLCPCGSGKKYKKCCEERLTHKKKFNASVLSNGAALGKSLLGKATQISTNFFNRPVAPLTQEPRKPDEDKPHHPPEADRPM